MLEKDIVAAIRRYLATLGEDVFFWKEHGGAYGTSGVPDIICCYRGRFLGLEVKRPGQQADAAAGGPSQGSAPPAASPAGWRAWKEVKDIIRQADGERRMQMTAKEYLSQAFHRQGSAQLSQVMKMRRQRPELHRDADRHAPAG